MGMPKWRPGNSESKRNIHRNKPVSRSQGIFSINLVSYNITGCAWIESVWALWQLWGASASAMELLVSLFTSRPLHLSRKKYAWTIFAAIYFHILSKYMAIIGWIRACHDISMTISIFMNVVHARYVPIMMSLMSTNRICAMQNIDANIMPIRISAK